MKLKLWLWTPKYNNAMDNENFDSPSLEDQEMMEEAPSFDSDPEPQPRTIGLWWRVLVGLVALLLLGGLLYPFLQSQSTPGVPEDTPLPTSEQPATPPVTLAAEADSPEEWFELGKTYYQQGQWAQAVAAFQQVITLDPTYQAAYANLGAAYHRQNNLDLAVAQYQKALELNPEDGEVIYNLAAVYLQQATQSGQPDPALLEQAIEQLNLALELSPDAAEPYFGLGVAYTALNQKEQAISSFETFLERDTGSDPRAQEEAKRYLEFLKN